MSKRTILLIIILALVTAGLLYVALTGTTPKRVIAPGPTPTPVSPNAKTTLSMTEAPASLSSQLTQHTVAVSINTTNNVNGVQLEIGYDPNTIINVSVAPGTFFKQPSILVKNINTQDGRISYTLTEQVDLKGDSGKGIVALISFDTLPTAKADKTTLVFMPKTAVSASGVLESVLQKTQDYTLTLPTPSAALPATGSAK